jgi:hypothetical protein
MVETFLDIVNQIIYHWLYTHYGVSPCSRFLNIRQYMAKHWMVKRNILMLDGYARHSPIIGLYPHHVPIMSP